MNRVPTNPINQAEMQKLLNKKKRAQIVYSTSAYFCTILSIKCMAVHFCCKFYFLPHQNRSKTDFLKANRHRSGIIAGKAGCTVPAAVFHGAQHSLG